MGDRIPADHQCVDQPCFGCGRGLDRWQLWQRRQFRKLREELAANTTAVRSLTESMVQLMSDQSHLDADVQALGAGLDAIEAEIAQLKQANPAVDFTGLDAAVSRLQADAPAPGPSPAT